MRQVIERESADFGSGYAVTVQKRTAHGWRLLHSFVFDGNRWHVWDVKKNVSSGALDDGGVVHLAKGVDISARATAVVLDALRGGSRHHVDVDDLKEVVSQDGRRISDLDKLDTERRRLAEPVLHAQILGRCAIV